MPFWYLYCQAKTLIFYKTKFGNVCLFLLMVGYYVPNTFWFNFQRKKGCLIKEAVANKGRNTLIYPYSGGNSTIKYLVCGPEQFQITNRKRFCNTLQKWGCWWKNVILALNNYWMQSLLWPWTFPELYTRNGKTYH